MPSLYVVLRDTGEYSDRERTVVGVATSLDSAQQMATTHADEIAFDEYEARKNWDLDASAAVVWTEDWQPAGPDRWGDVQPVRRHFKVVGSAFANGHYEITAHTLNQE